MKKNKMLVLIEKLSKYMNEEELRKFLKLDERILNALADIGYGFDVAVNIIRNDIKETRYSKHRLLNKVMLVRKISDRGNGQFLYEVDYNDIEMLEILGDAFTFDCARYAIQVLKNKDAVEAGIAKKGAKLLNCNSIFYNTDNVQYAAQVLCYYDAIKANIAYEGAALVLSCKDSDVARYVAYVLCNEQLIDAGFALESAKKIKNAPKPFNAKEATIVLSSQVALRAKLSLIAAEYVNDSKEPFNAIYVSAIFCNELVVDAGLACRAAKEINDSKTKFNAEAAYKILSNPSIIAVGNDFAIDAAKIVNVALTKEIADYGVNYIISNVDEPNVVMEASELIRVLNIKEKEDAAKKTEEEPTGIAYIIKNVRENPNENIKAASLARIFPKNNHRN